MREGEDAGESAKFMLVRGYRAIDPCFPSMPDGVRRAFADQADIACTEREAPRGIRRMSRVKGELHHTNNQLQSQISQPICQHQVLPGFCHSPYRARET